MQPFGTYAPKGRNRILYWLVRAGFGRGRVKKLLAQLWRNDQAVSYVDLHYHGLKLRLSRRANSIESKILFSSRLRERAELDVIRSAVKNGGTFVDIGGNIGYYSLMAAHFGAAEVVTVEPNVELTDTFEVNTALNGFDAVISLVPKVVGEAESTATLHLATHDLGSSSLLVPQGRYKSIEVEQTTLANVLAQHGICQIDALKIDVEGYEDKVLMPFFTCVAERLYPTVVIIEDAARAVWDRDVVEWMLGNGYDLTGRTRGNAILCRRKGDLKT